MNKQELSISNLEQIKLLSDSGKKIVFVSGNFNIVHPGHLRLFKFAADCGDILVVGINRLGRVGLQLMPAQIRLEGVKAIGFVQYACIMDGTPEQFIEQLKPDLVVKGKEYEGAFNPEAEVIKKYGGKLLFSSGEARFSSLDLMKRELFQANFSTIEKDEVFIRRHGFSMNDLLEIVKKFPMLKVVVVGDLIVDEYINCDALGMSREDPTLVVSPINKNMFIGGAGIVAAHARGLGANVDYICVTGNDSLAKIAEELLNEASVRCHFFTDDSRPTTVKQRYRVEGKTLLRVSHLKQHAIGADLVNKIYETTCQNLDSCDLLIFSDFNYGCLPQQLIERITEVCRLRNIKIVADSQSSSQIGDISRFVRTELLTPTEYEARLAMKDHDSGLVILAESLRQKTQAANIFVTLGSEGLLIHAPSSVNGDYLTDQLPALNSSPKDVSGAGDSLLTCASMALAVGASVWQSAYLGSLAAACQVSRTGNVPLSADELIMEIQA